MDEIEEQYELAQLLFATALEDKMRYLADLDKGEYIGYKPFGLREVKPGVPENTGVYNIPRFGRNVPTREQPDIITRNIAKIEKFSRHVHENIVMKLFLLFAMVLELPEDYFTKMHSYDDEHSSYLRYMKYHARTPGAKRGTRQYLAQGPQRFWLPDAAVSATYRGVAADTMQFLSNGFFKSSIHRVVAPPRHQAHLDRLGVLYFVRAGDEVVLRGADSPVLRREGLLASEDPKDSLMAKDWVAARTIANISKKEIDVENEKLNKIGAGLAPVYV